QARRRGGAEQRALGAGADVLHADRVAAGARDAQIVDQHVLRRALERIPLLVAAVVVVLVAARIVGHTPSLPPVWRRTAPRSSSDLGRSPHADAIGRREIEGGAGLDAEGGVPGVEVADRGGAIARGRVAVGQQDLAGGLVARLVAPRLGEAEEELLVAGEALERGRLLAGEREPVGV